MQFPKNNLTPEQLKIVTSHNFRMWFGDWMNIGFCEKLLLNNNYQNINEKQKRVFKWQEDELLKTLPKYKTKLSYTDSEIEICHTTYKKILLHGASDENYYLIYNLNQICNNSVFFDREPNREPKDTNTLWFDCYFAKAYFRNEPYIIRISVQVGHKNKLKLHDASAVKEETIKAAVRDIPSNRANLHGFEYKDRKIKQLCQTFPEKNSKVVDSQGVPIVCFHGTPTRPSQSNNKYVRSEGIIEGDKPYPVFWEFRHEYAITDSGWLGSRATYFTPDVDFAEEFGDRIIPCFLRILNPFVVNDNNSTDPNNTYRFLESLQHLKGLPEKFKLNYTLPESKTFTDYRGEQVTQYFRVSHYLDDKDKRYYGIISSYSKDDKGGIFEITKADSEKTAIAMFNDKQKYIERNGFMFRVVQDIGNEEFTKLLQDNGHDGLMDYTVYDFKEPVEKHLSEVLIYNSTQAKLADGTNTKFNVNNPDIRFSHGGTIPENIIFGKAEGYNKLFPIKDVLGNHIYSAIEWNNLPEEKKDKLKTTITRSVTNAQGKKFNVDYCLAPFLQRIIDMGYKTVQSDSGMVTDHPNYRNVYTGELLYPVSGGSGAYISFWKSTAAMVRDAGHAVNTDEQIEKLRAAGRAAGFVVQDSHTFFQPSIVFYLPETIDGTSHKNILKEANRLTNENHPEFKSVGENAPIGGKNFMKWLDLRNDIYEPIAIKNHGGSKFYTDAETAGKWNALIMELEKIENTFLNGGLVEDENFRETQHSSRNIIEKDIEYMLDGEPIGKLSYVFQKPAFSRVISDKYKSELFISVVEVEKEYRDKGVGVFLLYKAIADAKKLKVEVVTLKRDSGVGCAYGSEYDNYLKRIYSGVGFVESFTKQQTDADDELNLCAMHLDMKNYKSKFGEGGIITKQQRDELIQKIENLKKVMLDALPDERAELLQYIEQLTMLKDTYEDDIEKAGIPELSADFASNVNYLLSQNWFHYRIGDKLSKYLGQHYQYRGKIQSFDKGQTLVITIEPRKQPNTGQRYVKIVLKHMPDDTVNVSLLRYESELSKNEQEFIAIKGLLVDEVTELENYIEYELHKLSDK